MLKFLFRLFQIVFLLVLPFLLLIRGAVYLHGQYACNPWISVIGGMLATIFLLILYFTFISGKITGRLGRMGAFKKRGYLAAFMVFGFCLYGLVYLSGKHVKHPEVRKEYLSLHPILRMGVSTLILIDQDMIITDASRMPEDYRKMGLKTKRHSLHYKQSDGFVHAVDIRTNGRSEFRNFVISRTFRIMGFNTLRHGGTGDHLHISLQSHDRPKAI